MSVFNKLKASIGIGAATVDTVVDQDTYAQGDTVSGTVKVKGGGVEQELNGIDLYFMTTVIVEGEDSEYEDEYCFEVVRVGSDIKVQPGQELDLPFSAELPLDTPITNGVMNVWVRTQVDISMAVDPKDLDPLKVLPSKTYQSFLDAVGELGFHIRKVKNIKTHHVASGVAQKSEYIPMDGPFRGELDELELVVFPAADGIRVVTEVDRKAKGLGGLFAEALDVDESKASFFIGREVLESGSAAVREELERTLKKYL
ncbi:MAG TPA: sporulation protein [Bacillales bacterium]|nr:sporulation protein [Bacillales bacterium]